MTPAVEASSLPADLPSAAPGWHAQLALRFVADQGRTQAVDVHHRGPLRVQRSLRPESGACETLILHPPGGIAGGDTLDITVRVEPGAQVLLSTPGAAKWYRSAGRAATQRIRLEVAPNAILEWLPQESILFRDADAIQTLDIALADAACMIGWDIVQLGRVAANEAWDRGRFRQTLALRRSERSVWHEYADVSADDALHRHATGLAGRRVFGTLWATSPMLAAEPAQALERVRASFVDAQGDGLHSSPDSAQSSLCVAATWLAAPAELLLVRAVGGDAEHLRTALEAAWTVLRPLVTGREAHRPRIWNT